MSLIRRFLRYKRRWEIISSLCPRSKVSGLLKLIRHANAFYSRKVKRPRQSLKRLQKIKAMKLHQRQSLLVTIIWAWVCACLIISNYIDDVLKELLPPDIEEIPSGFETVGDIAHMNLTGKLYDLRYLIGQVVLEKNPIIRSVVTKIG